MFAALFTFIDALIVNNITDQVGVFSATISPLIGACVILYVIYLSYQSLYDPQNLVVMESIKMLVSLAAVTFIAFNTPWYLANIVPAVLNSGDNIAQAITGSSDSGGGAALQSMFDSVFSQIGALWGEIDVSITRPMTLIDAFLILFLQIPILLLGAIPFFAVALAYLLVAKIMVSFLLIIGPLFIMMAFFPSTRSFFQSWTGQIFNYTLLSLIYPLAFTTFSAAIDETVFNGGISFMKIIMTPVVFFALIVLSTQIPVLCSTLSGGIGISGLVGGIGTTGSLAGKGLMGGAKGVTKTGSATKNFAKNLFKGKIKAG